MGAILRVRSDCSDTLPIIVCRHLKFRSEFSVQAFYCPDESGRLVLTSTARNRIKMATRELRELTGFTLEEASAKTQISTTQWHNYENTEKTDLIPAHIYLPLELLLGKAPVTTAIAHMNGLSVASDEERASQKALAELTTRVVRSTGNALSTLVEATADNHISPNEAKKIGHVFGDVRDAAGEIVEFAAGLIPTRD